MIIVDLYGFSFWNSRAKLFLSFFNLNKWLRGNLGSILKVYKQTVGLNLSLWFPSLNKRVCCIIVLIQVSKTRPLNVGIVELLKEGLQCCLLHPYLWNFSHMYLSQQFSCSIDFQPKFLVVSHLLKANIIKNLAI